MSLLGCHREKPLCLNACEGTSECADKQTERDCREACEKARDGADNDSCLAEYDAVLECISTLKLSCDSTKRTAEIVESCSREGTKLAECEAHEDNLGEGGASAFGTPCSVGNSTCPADLLCGAPEQPYCTQVNCGPGEENEGVCPVGMRCVPTVTNEPASVCVY